jgi:hypothetical protein
LAAVSPWTCTSAFSSWLVVIGGFGVGSHFTYSILGLLGYRFQMFGHAAIAHAGYRTLSQNYATRTDGDLFTWDVTLQGPILGLTIRF